MRNEGAFFGQCGVVVDGTSRQVVGREENKRTGDPGRCDAASIEKPFVKVIEFDHFAW